MCSLWHFPNGFCFIEGVTSQIISFCWGGVVCWIRGGKMYALDKITREHHGPQQMIHSQGYVFYDVPPLLGAGDSQVLSPAGCLKICFGIFTEGEDEPI